MIQVESHESDRDSVAQKITEQVVRINQEVTRQPEVVAAQKQFDEYQSASRTLRAAYMGLSTECSRLRIESDDLDKRMRRALILKHSGSDHEDIPMLTEALARTTEGRGYTERTKQFVDMHLLRVSAIKVEDTRATLEFARSFALEAIAAERIQRISESMGGIVAEEGSIAFDATNSLSGQLMTIAQGQSVEAEKHRTRANRLLAEYLQACKITKQSPISIEAALV